MDLVGALDVGASKTLVTVRPVAFSGWESRFPTVRFPTPSTPDALVRALDASLAGLATKASGRIVAVGCGTPGPLDPDRGVVIQSPNQGWHDVPLGALLEERLGVPVLLEDDANAGALGEATLGAGRGADPVVFVTVGTGLGSGVVVAGRVLRGAHASAGEIGHLVLDPTGIRCGCGRRGCVETLAAGRGIERRARAAWSRAGAHRMPAPVTAEEVFRATRAGDPVARRIVDDGVDALAWAFAVVVATIDPERIVVGGAVGVGQRGYVRRAALRARRRYLPGSAAGLQVVPAALGRECVLAGAAVMAARAHEAVG